MVSHLLDTAQFTSLREELESYDAAREELIKHSRDLLRDAKHAIYLVHQEELAQAVQLIDSLRTQHASVENEYVQTLVPSTIGPYADALEEYVEAACFVAYSQDKQIPTRTELAVPVEQYLCGLADLSGELVRRAVFAATKRDTATVRSIWEFINSLQGELLQFHLRNGQLRKKYDSIKYNLKKVEEILYDLQLRAQ